MDVLTAYFIAGAIIFIGFFADIFFSRTGLPDVLILLLVGIILGPLLHLVSTAMLMQIAPYFSALALILLLLEGGMHMNFRKVVTEFSTAFSFMIIVFSVSTIFVSIIMLFLGWPLEYGVLLGAVIGGSSSAIVIPLLSKVNVKEEIRTLLNLESAFTDAVCIIVALTVVPIILSGHFDLQSTLHALSSSFSIAAVIGFAFGLLWLKVLRSYKTKQLVYLLTLGTCFIMYSVVESLGGNGTIASLLFGLVLGNAREIGKIFRIEDGFEINSIIEKFNAEVAFFVKTFFFVYLGMLFNPNALNPSVLSISLVVAVGIVLARFWVAKRYLGKLDNKEKELVGFVLPRGLAAAVLSFIPITFNLNIPFFTEIVISIIFISNLITILEIYRFQKIAPKKEEEESGVIEMTKVKEEEEKKSLVEEI